MATRITTSDAAAIYHIPARTLRNWHAAGRITAERRGRALLWDCAELDQLTGQRTHGRLPRSPLMAHHQH